MDESVISSSQSPQVSLSMNTWFGGRKVPSVDLTHAQASVTTASQKAGAYINSWSSWASERRKEWQEKRNTTVSPPSTGSPSMTSPVEVNEKPWPDRGRQRSPHRKSEDFVGLGRSGSRRTRWSSILRMKDRGESGSPRREAETGLENRVSDGVSPKPLLSKTRKSTEVMDEASDQLSSNTPVSASLSETTEELGDTTQSS
jgi:hypothetical protein